MQRHSGLAVLVLLLFFFAPIHAMQMINWAHAEPSSVRYNGTFSFTTTLTITDPDYWPTFREQRTCSVSASFSNLYLTNSDTGFVESVDPNASYNGDWSLVSPISNNEYTKTFNPTSGHVSGTFRLGFNAQIKNGVLSFQFTPNFTALDQKLSITETRSYMANEPLPLENPFNLSPSRDAYAVLTDLAWRTGTGRNPPTSSTPYQSQTITFNGTMPPGSSVGLRQTYTWSGTIKLDLIADTTLTPTPTPSPSRTPSPSPTVPTTPTASPSPTPTSTPDLGAYTVTFIESGLPANATWWVVLDGHNKSSTTDTIVFFKDTGTYEYKCGVTKMPLESLFLLKLVGTRSTTSGTTSPTGMGFVNYSALIPMADDFFVDGAAVKPDQITFYEPREAGGHIVVSGDNVAVQVQTQGTWLTVTDTITMHYLYPDGTSLIRTAQADFTPASLGGYSATSTPETYAQTFDVLHSPLLQNHAGNWSVQAIAEIKLSSPTFSQTLNLQSNVLQFNVAYSGSFNWTVSVNGIPNFVTVWMGNESSCTEPNYTSDGRNYNISFTMMGPTGRNGSITMAIPTTVVPSDFHPIVTVNGTQYNRFNWNFSQSNYYIYITLTFSTENVEITFLKDGNFETPSPSGVTPTFMLTTYTMVEVAAVVATIVVVAVVVVALKHRKKHRTSFDFPPPPPP